MSVDVAIIGGGPAGLSAALILGRARKRVLFFDAGPRRNAAAAHIQGFVTQDGTPPTEFRRIGHEQLQPYASVSVRKVVVDAVEPHGKGFLVRAGGEAVETRRVLLCTGVIDELPALPGLGDLWGHAVVQCPYCHGWEVRDGAIGVLTPSAEMLEFSFLLTGWSRDIVAFTEGLVPDEPLRARLRDAGIRVESRKVRALVGAEGARLEAVELEDGARVSRQVLFMRTPQHQVEVVKRLGVACNEMGYVRVDEFGRTSLEGVWAAGDLTTNMQSAILAAAAGARAAYMLNHELTMGHG